MPTRRRQQTSANRANRPYVTRNNRGGYNTVTPTSTGGVRVQSFNSRRSAYASLGRNGG